MADDRSLAVRGHSAESASGQGFGTFKGVFTPSILTILGVIMYLRVGWVLGNVGLGGTLLIVTLSSAITFLTGLSISAIATNMKVGGGGAYFMISRSLGLEPGAAIGLPLFLSQALVVSFYITGFAESVHALFPHLPLTLVSVATLVGLTALAFLSADAALKTQFFILALIVMSLVSLFAGGVPEEGFASPTQVPARSSFWIVFAIFFPAVTGILSGVAMSGDLKNPARSLPVGTLAAVGTGYVVYMAIPIFLDSLAPRHVLLSDPMIMLKVARWGDAIVLGIWGATLSSALSSLLGAPRTLQALARDGVVPTVLGRGNGSRDEPRIATGATFLIALAGVLAGDLNAIGPILSMFFLTSYGVLNFSAGVEGLISSPSWRPKFKVHWSIPMLGAFACFATMIMINPGATLIAGFLCTGVFYYTQRRELQAHWGDMRYGILMLLARYAVYRLDESKPDEKTWRPNILVLSGAPSSRWYLIELAASITHGEGFLTVAAILDQSSTSNDRAQQLRRTVKDYLKKRGVAALVEVSRAESVLQGARSLVRTHGLGPLVPNTFLLGETERTENYSHYAGLLQTIYRSRRNAVVIREGSTSPVFGRGRRIDVWWRLDRQNAGLMLALGYMLKTSSQWREAELTLKTIVPSTEEKEMARRRHQEFLDRGRLEAQAKVIVHGGKDKSVFELIGKASRNAHLVFLGIRPPEEDEPPERYAEYYASLIANTDSYPPTGLVLAAEDIEFQRIFE